MTDRFDPEDLERFQVDLMNALYAAQGIAREAEALDESLLLGEMSDAVEHGGLQGLLECVQNYRPAPQREREGSTS